MLSLLAKKQSLLSIFLRSELKFCYQELRALKMSEKDQILNEPT